VALAGAVLELRVIGALPAGLTAATVRAIAGARTVTVAIRTADRLVDNEGEVDGHLGN
jgi:hypothetical protein